MSGYNFAIDQALAAALRGEHVGGSRLLTGADDVAAMIERVDYHGVAGLLHERPAAMSGWPGAVKARVRDAALAQTMWELRHREILVHLVGALGGAKVLAILLKGTALAYDLYAAPAARARGDSDLLVDPRDLAVARNVLERQGFDLISGGDGEADAFSLQEVWSRTCDSGMTHHIDLHWHVLNAPALEDLLSFAECAADRIALPRLGPAAFAMDRVRTLIHTCIHRALNSASPYFVDGRTYYGGDRLIWLNDIHLLAAALSPAEWDEFCRLAGAKGVSSVCLDGLLAAERFLATPVPPPVRVALGLPCATRAPSAYLGARQLGRAWRDLRAIPGIARKIGYVRTRLVPAPSFVRDKYASHARLPLPLLYARRMLDLFRARPTQSPKR